jgi:hypothetical protein
MTEVGWYYLHSESHDLIYKKYEFKPELDSPFVVRVWPVSTDVRETAWQICVEGLYLGAKPERVKELAEKWQLTPEDSLELLVRMPPNKMFRKALLHFMKVIHGLDEEAYWKFIDEEAERRDAEK